jgi:hypothetical protein
MSKSKGDFRLATLQGKDEWEAESLSVMLNRYAQATQKAYQAQWVWWQLFCNRRGLYLGAMCADMMQRRSSC